MALTVLPTDREQLITYLADWYGTTPKRWRHFETHTLILACAFIELHGIDP